MKVKDAMVETPVSCASDTDLAEAAEKLSTHNCGVLPVVDAQEKVVGVITDRDMCIALGTRNEPADKIQVGQVASERVVACKPDDDIHAALTTMAEAKVRRLPVVSPDGKLVGILSMDDVVLHSEGQIVGVTEELSYDDVVNTLKSIYRAELPQRIH
jgi:CBS domain-containing protein